MRSANKTRSVRPADLSNARSGPGLDVVPTFTCSNNRITLLLGDKFGLLRIEDAERLQVGGCACGDNVYVPEGGGDMAQLWNQDAAFAYEATRFNVDARGFALWVTAKAEAMACT